MGARQKILSLARTTTTACVRLSGADLWNAMWSWWGPRSPGARPACSEGPTGAGGRCRAPVLAGAHERCSLRFCAQQAGVIGRGWAEMASSREMGRTMDCSSMKYQRVLSGSKRQNFLFLFFFSFNPKLPRQPLTQRLEGLGDATGLHSTLIGWAGGSRADASFAPKHRTWVRSKRERPALRRRILHGPHNARWPDGLHA